MTTRILAALLALSVIFNIFFVIGTLGHSPERESMRRLQRIANDLELNPQQSNRLTELRTSFNGQAAILQNDLHRVRQEIASELDAESPDLDRVRALMQEEGELAAARRASAARHFGDFIDLLTPEQRHMLGRRFEPSRRGGQGLPPETIARFDSDGDGTLNEAEHAKAHAEMRQHQERRRGWREEARRKFDVNQNGQLEPEEREAMRAWLLEQGFDVQKIMDRPHGRQNGARRGPRGPGGPRSDQPGQRPPHPPESPLGNPPPDSPPA
jgi:Spy/CpxP family protein refolding chaperone